MRKIKKFLSILMLLIIINNTIGLPEFFSARVLAAVTLAANTRMTMTTGSINPAPVTTTSNIPQDSVFLSWDFRQNVVSYELNYHLHPDLSVRFVINKQGDFADVEYIVTDASGNVYNPGFYQAYTIGVTSDVGRYVNHDEYPNPDDPLDPDSKNFIRDGTPPSFRISSDRGFSFKYGDQTIHFKWDAATGFLLFSTDGIQPGNIYDFALMGTDGTNSSLTVFNGADLDTMIVTPTADNGNKTVSDMLDQVNRSDPNPGADINGDDDVGMRIEIAMPKVWDTASKSFVPPSTPGVTLPRLQTVIQLNNQNAAHNLQIIIDDITNITNSPPNYTLNPPDSDAVLHIESVKNGDAYVINLTNLPAGQIYRSSTIETTPVTGSTPITTRPANVPFATFFTFPRYSIEPRGENYFVVLEPYAGYSGFYMLTSNASPPAIPKDPTRDPDAVIVESNGTEQIIYLPISSSAGRQAYYQVFFSPMKRFEESVISNEYVYSQILFYQIKPGAVEIDTPVFYEVTGLNLVMPPGDLSGEKGELDMWFRWDIGSYNTISTLLDAALAEGRSSLEIEYVIATGLTPEDSSTNDLATVRLNITRDNTGKLMVVYSDPEGKGRVLNTAPEVIIIEPNPSTSNDRCVGWVHLQLEAGHKELNPYPAPDLEYPNIYFTTIRPITRNGKDLNVAPSMRDSFTLDYFTALEVPPPQNLMIAGEPRDDGTFDVTWSMSASKIREYMNLATNLPNDVAKFSMNLYISSDEAYMRDSFYKYDYADRIKNSVGFNSGYTAYTYRDGLYFSSVDANPAMAGNGGYPDARAAIRDGKVVRVTDIPVTPAERDDVLSGGSFLERYYELNGLDKNQKYYIYVDFVVDHDITDDTVIPKASKTSNLAGVTTKGDKEIPTGEDKVPEAPKLSVTNIDLGEATIQWPAIPATTVSEVIEYQILRVTDTQMESRYLDTAEPFGNYWNIYLDGLAKLGMETSGSNILIYENGEFTASNPLQYIYNSSADRISFTDKTLTPNKLYFYYVRTVKTFFTSDGETVTYSSWAHVSVTTDPVKSPMNLRVETARNDYDSKTEIIISFDAPIPDINNLGPVYNLQYQLKEEGKDWSAPVTMPADVLKETAVSISTPDYYHFTYKIVGLNAGTSYTVRVRMTDGADNSLYTDPAQFRTTLDQEDYTSDQDIRDWEYYLEKELRKLLADPSWMTADTTGVSESVLRPSMWNDLIARSTDSTILLPQTGTGNTSYLIPSSALIDASNVNKGFKIVHGNNEIIIAPNSIDTNYNQAMADITAKLNRNEISDYYLRITLTWSDEFAPIDGNEAVGKSVNVRFELVGTKTTVKDWDAQLLRDFEAFIDAYLKNEAVKSDLGARIKGDNSNEAMVRHVDDMVKEAKAGFLKQVTESYGNNAAASYEVSSLQKPFSLVAKGLDPAYVIRAYRRQGTQWIAVDVSPYGDDFAVYTTTPGMFVFTGGLLNVPGMNEMQNAGTLTRIITKYGLDDFLGRGGFDLDADATGLMAAGCVARIMGAPKDSDPYSWLSKNKGVTLSSRGMNNSVSAQEAVYLAALLYEAKSGISLSAMQVRNYNATASMQGLDDKYRVHVRAASELGLIDASKFIPGAAISVRDVLKMIDAIDVMLKL